MVETAPNVKTLPPGLMKLVRPCYTVDPTPPLHLNRLLLPLLL